MEHGAGIGLWHLLIGIIWIAVIILPFWKIWSKAGFTGWLSLLMIVPLINLVSLYYLAFARWPTHERASAYAGRIDSA